MAWFRTSGDNGGSLKVLTASDDIASFETNLVAPYQSVIVDVVATGGNGTPDNPNPIVGYSSANITRCGVNLAGGETLADIIVDKVSDAVKDTTTKTITYDAPKIRNVVIFDHFKANTQYTFFIDTDSGLPNLKIVYTDDSIKELNEGVTTSASDKNIKSLSGSWQSGTTVLKYDEFGIMEGVKTLSDFTPYNGQTYTVSFGQTVYGGQLDVTRGKLHVTKGSADLGDLSWTRWTNDSAYYIFYATLADKKNTSDNTGLCSSFPILATNATGADYAKGLLDTDNKVCLSKGTSNPTIYIRCDTYTDANAFKTAMTGQTIVYELATPFDIDLTPEVISAIVGENNVWADCGSTTVEYLKRE